MRKSFCFLIFAILLSCGKDNQSERVLLIPEGKTPAPTAYYFIRHAEKKRSDVQDKNPQLSDKGFARTKFWGEYFKDKNLQKFFTTDYMRTFQTIIPIVYPYKGDVEFYEVKDSMFTKEFWESTYGKNTLVVGHSNTTPQFVNEIIGLEKYKNIPDSINHRVYRVEINESGIVAKDTFENVLAPSLD